MVFAVLLLKMLFAFYKLKGYNCISATWSLSCSKEVSLETLCKPGPCARAREWARLGVDPVSWLLSNIWLGEVHFVKLLRTSPNWLLLSNQDKGSTPSLAHSLALPHGPPGFARPYHCNSYRCGKKMKTRPEDKRFYNMTYYVCIYVIHTNSMTCGHSSGVHLQLSLYCKVWQ